MLSLFDDFDGFRNILVVRGQCEEIRASWHPRQINGRVVEDAIEGFLSKLVGKLKMVESGEISLYRQLLRNRIRKDL